MRRAIVLTIGLVLFLVAPAEAAFEGSYTGYGGRVSSSPGSRIVFSKSADSGLRLVSMEPDGSDRRVIPTPPGDPWLPSLSPDGTRIAVAMFRARNRSIWVMKVDGAHARRVASADNVSQPSWSPDGDRIAYSASTDAEGTSSVHIVNPDGSDDHAIYSIPAPGTTAIFSATFSPDGSEILFDQGTDAEFDIHVMDADASNVRQLTTTGVDYNPQWAPDGTRIAFTRQGRGAQSDIWLMDVDGSNPKQLTSGPPGQTNLSPTWSPGGRKIAYIAGITGGPGSLVVMNPDGTNPITLVKRNVLGLTWQRIPTGF